MLSFRNENGQYYSPEGSEVGNIILTDTPAYIEPVLEVAPYHPEQFKDVGGVPVIFRGEAFGLLSKIFLTHGTGTAIYLYFNGGKVGEIDSLKMTLIGGDTEKGTKGHFAGILHIDSTERQQGDELEVIQGLLLSLNTKAQEASTDDPAQLELSGVKFIVPNEYLTIPEAYDIPAQWEWVFQGIKESLLAIDKEQKE